MHSHRILFVDDHPLILFGLADLLRKQGYQVDTAKKLAAAIECISKAPEKYDVILLDINLGHENGLDLLDKMESGCAERVILLSGNAEQEWVLRGFEKGVFGFIPKSIEPEEVVSALSAMLAGDRLQNSGWVWETALKKLVDAQDFFPRSMTLTPKEREVFLLLRTGKLDKQIADELNLSIHTVRVHLRAIKRKRGHNRRFEQNFEG